MRQRAIKDRDAIVSRSAAWIAENPLMLKGRWKEIFANRDAPLHLEIGSGKGRFICEMAVRNPNINFIACEGAVNIYIRILQKAQSCGIGNLKLINSYIENAADYFAEGEISRIYLNFSDPWPRDKHAKRRLSCRTKLRAYQAVAAPGALLTLKTDNDPFFEYSLEEIRSQGMLLRRVSRDLKHSPCGEFNVETEYEEKFLSRGKSINFLEAVLRREK